MTANEGMINFLLPFSWLYGCLTVARNAAFDLHIVPAARAGVPVISVGNLTTGGTGKTPLVEYIARYLLRKGKRVGIVSRGYRRESRGVVVVSDGRSVLVDARKGGDEPVQMARSVPGVCVVVGERRKDAAAIARSGLGVEVIILDDGFQHRFLSRDLDILLLDARKDITAEPLLPAGTRREPLAGVRRAGLVALSRMEGVQGIPAWTSGLSQWYTGSVVTIAGKMTDARRALDDSPVALDELLQKPAFGFSGIADHRGFLEGARRLGFTLRGDRRFQDHHSYSAADLDLIRRGYRDSRSEIMLTTEKDVVRLLSFPRIAEAFPEIDRLYSLRLMADITGGEEALTAAIDRCLEGAVKL